MLQIQLVWVPYVKNVNQEMLNTVSNKKSLFAVLSIAVLEALIHVATQMCSEGSRKWSGS